VVSISEAFGFETVDQARVLNFFPLAMLCFAHSIAALSRLLLPPKEKGLT
jgi:hypothetical protein